MNSPRKISVVIPVLNEEKTLPSLLSALATQTLQPNEIFFIDAGSTDQSKAIIRSWVKLGLTEANVTLIDNPSGLPGANRNIGVQNARPGNWIAFLDAGITPNMNWLSSLDQTAESANATIVFGRCKFQAYSAFQTAVCALSYGCNNKPVMPNSLFHPDVFLETAAGLFREDLRAAEDTLWLSKLDSISPKIISTPNITSEYTHFPQSTLEVIRKWSSYEWHINKAGIPRKKVDCLILFFTIAAISIWINFYLTLIMMVVYIFSRGIADPAYRSKNIFWWKTYPLSFFYTIYLGIMIDFAICKSRISFALSR